MKLKCTHKKYMQIYTQRALRMVAKNKELNQQLPDSFKMLTLLH